MDSKKFVPVSVYLTHEDFEQVMDIAKVTNQSKSGACELLIRRGLGKVGDFQIEQLCEEARARKSSTGEDEEE